MRHLALSLVAFLFVVTVTPRNLAAQQPTSLAELYSAFTAGNTDGLYRAFSTEADLRQARGTLFQFVRGTASDWRPSRAAFLLHVIHIASNRGWSDTPLLLTASRDVLVSRPTPIGRNASEDAFEITWHRAAVGILMGSHDFTRGTAYLTAIASRLSATAAPNADVLVDPRLSFTRGLLTDLSLVPFTDQPLQRPDVVPSLVFDPRNGFVRTRAEQALAAYARATDASVAPEAGIRSGLLLYRLGRHAEALERLRSATVPPTDRFLAYLRALFIGRVEEALGHTAEAVAAYEGAGSLFPQAQTPAVALASLLQRQDRPADAARWASAVTALPPDAFDPWWRYWAGDYWRVPDWLAELRRVQP